MQPAAVEARLEEWSRWCLSGKYNRGHARSLEGRYRSPQCWDLPPTTAYAGPTNVARAYEVECVVVTLDRPWHQVLVWVYVRKYAESDIRRKLQRHRVRGTVQTVLQEAQRRVGIALLGSARPRSQPSSYLGSSELI